MDDGFRFADDLGPDKKVGANVRAVLEEAQGTDAAPRPVAEALAGRRVRAAMALRRWPPRPQASPGAELLDL